MAGTEDRRRVSDESHTEILEILHEIKTELAARKHLDEKILSLDKCVNGNGTPGLKTDMQIVKDQLNRFNWVAGILSAAVIADLANRILTK